MGVRSSRETPRRVKSAQSLVSLTRSFSELSNSSFVTLEKTSARLIRPDAHVERQGVREKRMLKKRPAVVGQSFDLVIGGLLYLCCCIVLFVFAHVM